MVRGCSVLASRSLSLAIIGSGSATLVLYHKMANTIMCILVCEINASAAFEGGGIGL